MKKIRQRKGLLTLIVLALLLLFVGADLIWLGKTHVSPGSTLSGGFGDESRGDIGSDFRRESNSESEYKRQSYFEGGGLLLLGVATLCGVIGAWKKRDRLENSWEQTISNPQNVQDIQEHPETYRNEFRQWIKENHPDLLLGKSDESG